MTKIGYVVFLILMSCQSTPESNLESTNTAVVDTKYSVAQDRSEFDKLRQSIPVETRKQNDEKALVAELTAELKYAPEVAREKFSNIVRKKRELFNNDMQKSRDQFNKLERKTREVYFKSLQEERDTFLKRKVDRDQRSAFFNEQDEARRTFLSEQREKRDEFEADTREKRKTFEDYVKERQDTFNAELKSYTVRYLEKLKADKEAEENK